jgi:hypothetical protein
MGVDAGPALDAVLSVGPRHVDVAPLAIESLRQWAPIERVSVISSRSVAESLSGRVNCDWIDEDRLLPGWTLERFKGEPAPRFPEQAPWYFQQFLKMGIARLADTAPWYLIWDADSVLLRPTPFFTEDGRAFLTRGTERQHSPYFETYRRLLGEPANLDSSYISQHAVVDREVMCGLLDEIEARSGTDFVSAVLAAIRDGQGLHLFSEYETFAAFAQARAPARYRVRSVPWLRDGSRVLGKVPNPGAFPKLAEDYAFASFEHWQPRRWKHRVRYFLRHGVWV